MSKNLTISFRGTGVTEDCEGKVCVVEQLTISGETIAANKAAQFVNEIYGREDEGCGSGNTAIQGGYWTPHTVMHTANIDESTYLAKKYDKNNWRHELGTLIISIHHSADTCKQAGKKNKSH